MRLVTREADAPIFLVQEGEKVRTVRTYAGEGLAGGGWPFSFLISTIAPHASNSLHKHSCDEVMFIKSGSGTATVGDQREPVGTHSLIYAPAGSWHQVFNESDEPMNLLCFFIPPLPERELAVILGSGKPADEG
jgi:mannose-6-phosphate isomerase-like protein (cupin superfamily)